MILGLSGQMESGKSTVANILVENLGFKELSFAGDLKELCKYVFSLTDHHVYTTEGKAESLNPKVLFSRTSTALLLEWVSGNVPHITGDHIRKVREFEGMEFETPRKLLQILGTDVLRNTFGQDYHVKIVKGKILRPEMGSVVVSDARFENERRMLRECGGLNILIKCAQQTESYGTHISENNLGEISDYDYVLFNDKDRGLEVLKAQVLTLLGPKERKNATA